MGSQERIQNDQNQSKSEESINTKDFLIGALIGGIVGAATALFLAPKSGKELRTNMNEQAIVLKAKTGQIRETAVAKGTVLASAAKEKTNAITNTVSKQSAEIMNKVKGLKTNDEGQSLTEEGNMGHIPLPAHDSEIQKRLEDTKRAFDETEKKVRQ
ncbi:YtxH domain-containing protein [Cytobacillus massiliigabonensis]|uniref:YtxH domain-containing protein n=1 Tax=Cytobacillus massiliigabonensis TaxID=1871011 RepID=UPI000C8270EF|nr:YtxH domain-containing protein [Cytobacillus massiliigabonensis]